MGIKYSTILLLPVQVQGPPGPQAVPAARPGSTGDPPSHIHSSREVNRLGGGHSEMHPLGGSRIQHQRYYGGKNTCSMVLCVCMFACM